MKGNLSPIAVIETFQMNTNKIKNTIQLLFLGVIGIQPINEALDAVMVVGAVAVCHLFWFGGIDFVDMLLIQFSVSCKEGGIVVGNRLIWADPATTWSWWSILCFGECVAGVLEDFENKMILLYS